MIPFFLFIVWFLKRDPIIFNWFTSISFPSFHSFKEAWCTRSLLVHLIFLYFIKSYSLIPFSLSWRRWLWRRSSVSIVVIFLMPVPGTKIRRPAREWNVKGRRRRIGNGIRCARTRITGSIRSGVRISGWKPIPVTGKPIVGEILRKPKEIVSDRCGLSF